MNQAPTAITTWNCLVVDEMSDTSETCAGETHRRKLKIQRKKRLPYKVLLVDKQISTGTFSVIEKHPNIWYPNLHLKVWPHQGTDPKSISLFCRGFSGRDKNMLRHTFYITNFKRLNAGFSHRFPWLEFPNRSPMLAAKWAKCKARWAMNKLPFAVFFN